MPIRSLIPALCLASSVPVFAQEPPEQARDSVGWVESQKMQLGPRQNKARAFSVDSFDQSTSAVLVSMTEDLFVNVEKSTGLDLVNTDTFWLEVLARNRGLPNGENIVIGQSYAEAIIRQRILVWDLPSMDVENYLESGSWLVLNRYVQDRQSPLNRHKNPSVVPDWISTGVAQGLISPLRIRNQQMLERILDDRPFPSIRRILEWESLPSGRWAEKVVASQFIHFLQDSSDKASLFESLFARLAENGTLDINDLVAVCRAENAEALERKWQKWVQARKTTVLIPGLMSLATLKEFSVLLNVNKGDFGIPRTAEFPEGMDLSGLVALREDPWVRAFSSSRINEMNLLAIGRGSEMEGLVSLYKVYLMGLTGKVKDDELLVNLAKANNAFSTIQTNLEKRSKYLKGIEDKMLIIENTQLSTWYWKVDAPPRSQTQKYIDQMERRF